METEGATEGRGERARHETARVTRSRRCAPSLLNSKRDGRTDANTHARKAPPRNDNSHNTPKKVQKTHLDVRRPAEKVDS